MSYFKIDDGLFEFDDVFFKLDDKFFKFDEKLSEFDDEKYLLFFWLYTEKHNKIQIII